MFERAREVIGERITKLNKIPSRPNAIQRIIDKEISELQQAIKVLEKAGSDERL